MTDLAAQGWQQGVSFGSAGRLGAHAAGFEPAENGYLTYQVAGATFMLIRPSRNMIGSLQLPPRHSVSEKTLSWTLRETHFRAAAQAGFPKVDLRVLASVLSPAITFASDADRLLRWRWQVGASPELMAMPRGDSLRLVDYSPGWSWHGRPVHAMHGQDGRRGDQDARATPAWLLTFNPAGGANVPVLWIFPRRRPARIEVSTHEYMDFHFAGPFGRVLAMPLYGSAEIDRDELKRLAGGDGLRELAERCGFWANALAGLPDLVDDYFRIDERAGTVHVREVGRRLDGRRPTVSPVPPFLAAATHGRYPVRIDSPPLPAPKELCTHYGPYRVVRGGSIRYSMPLCPYLDTVLSPVRVLGDRRAAALTRRLRDYFDDPRYTYGGDGTYDPASLLDILHNLRVLAWAAWALPDDQRGPAHAAIVRDLERLFDPGSYRYYREPVTGRRFARDRDIFGYRGEVTYDFDWYSGMNLAGLWAGLHFGAISLELIRRRWQLVSDIEAYFEIFQDWATLAPWTDARGELLNTDCARHGVQGMIGFARLARRFGTPRQREIARYIASRSMIFWAAEHELLPLYEVGGVPWHRYGRKSGSRALGFGGLRERDSSPGAFTASSANPYTLSPLNPEHMLFLRDFGPVEMLQQYEAKWLDQELPGWDTKPAKVYFVNRPPGSIERNAGAYHFYMVDPHLLLRMLVLDWPARRAIGKVRELSGQVIAAALVADAPKVFSPAGVEFRGTTWDARRHVLTIRAGARQGARAGTGAGAGASASTGNGPESTWLVLWPKKPRSISGPPGAGHHFRAGRLTLTAPSADTIAWRISY